jgi:hypothetical protein
MDACLHICAQYTYGQPCTLMPDACVCCLPAPPLPAETETTTFTDCVNCLIAFTNNPHSLQVALNSIAFLRFCASRLAEGAIGELPCALPEGVGVDKVMPTRMVRDPGRAAALCGCGGRRASVGHGAGHCSKHRGCESRALLQLGALWTAGCLACLPACLPAVGHAPSTTIHHLASCGAHSTHAAAGSGGTGFHGHVPHLLFHTTLSFHQWQQQQPAAAAAGPAA